MGYAQTTGFRAGTSRPFYFYDLDFEVQTPLKLVPYVFSPSSLEELEPDEVRELIAGYTTHLEEIGGELRGILRNNSFALALDNRSWRALYTEQLNA